MRKIEIAANAATILVAILVCFTLVQRARESRPTPTSVKSGDSLRIPGMDWKGAKANLVLALSTECRYCTDSVPFYRRVVSKLAAAGVHTVALFPQTDAVAAAYLKKHQVDVGVVRQTALPRLRIYNTPTVVLVNGEGVVSQVWQGRLSATQEEAMVHAAMSLAAAAAPSSGN
jgi:hypothetical protein